MRPWTSLKERYLHGKIVVSHPPGTYATEKVFVETEMRMQNFKMLSYMTVNQYARAIWTRNLEYNQMHTEYTLKIIILEGLPGFSCTKVRSFLSSDTVVTLRDSTGLFTSLQILYELYRHTSNSYSKSKSPSEQGSKQQWMPSQCRDHLAEQSLIL